MQKQKCNLLRFAAVGIALCLSVFVACENDTDSNGNTENETGNETESTKVRFNNLEQYKVTIYRDSLRQNVFAEVVAMGSTVVAATPSASGTVFYPTFNLELFDIQGIGVPYNAPGIVTTIAENSTTDVPIPKLESIDINSAFIKVINNSSSSLTLRQGGAEINLLGASYGIVAPNQSAVYEVAPGLVSGYSLMRNTVTPVDFPADITEFKRGIIYVFTYNGTNLSLTQIKSVPGTSITIEVPGANLAAKLSWLQTNAQSNINYTVEVTTDESIGPTTLSYNNRSNIGITLKGTGATRIIGVLFNGAMFTVRSGVTLVLDNNITLQGRSNNNNSLVIVNSGGTLVMNAGSAVTGNTAYYSSSSSASYGGGVYVYGTNATFTMNGGAISGNTTSGYNSSGGGVYVDSGTFTMNSGNISGNTASSGGGVYVGDGTFTMNGGTVLGNTASYGGGGVDVGYGTFTMSGGTISGNTANRGGGVNVYGTFTMSGGTVLGNTAAEAGGGVFLNQGTFSKTNGTIYGYSASDTVNSNAVKDSSGTVSNNYGHAVCAGNKRKETTAGTSVTLSWRYNNGSPVFSGDWDTDPPINNEANPIPLTENIWVNDYIISGIGVSAVWYSFNVTSGTTYRVWWNDSYAGNSTKTLDVKVSAYYSNGTSIFTGEDSGWSTARSFTASSSGTVKIKVEPYSSGSTGTFAIVYSTGNSRP